jgi:hypothetical protein
MKILSPGVTLGPMFSTARALLELRYVRLETVTSLPAEADIPGENPDPVKLTVAAVFWVPLVGEMLEMKSRSLLTL